MKNKNSNFENWHFHKNEQFGKTYKKKYFSSNTDVSFFVV
jgi:hypothetical protein